MGSFRFRRSVKLGPGVRLNVSKTGLGVSAGPQGARMSMHSSGRRTTSAGIPGTGLGYTATRSGAGQQQTGSSRAASTPQPPPRFPKPGFFAPKHEKEFAKALEAYAKGDTAKALTQFQAASEKDTSDRAVADDLFAGIISAQTGETEQAIGYLEKVVASETELPDELMQKYRLGGHMALNVTEHVQAEVPWSSLAAALTLVECYQEAGRRDEAIGVLKQLADAQPDPVLILSLCDLYAEAGAWDELVDVAAGIQNEDDITLQIRLFQARALREQGLKEAALEAYKDSLRSKKRDPDLLKEARYERGTLLLELGKAAQGKKDLEQVYANDPKYRDVAELVRG
jgi:tetratricopeptide (TPR) repeat protein